ncbi:MAG TPA: adenylosuccinate synthase [Kofleriaceae bacterium]|nr:adenylosuccinate synthase [Kofleriaceae bacterium]
MPKRWSTKNLHVIEPATAARTGLGIFEFTDDYSVFHFSKMPDQIPGKGEALSRMAGFTLERVRRAGVPTHFVSFDPPNQMKIRLVRVINPAERPLSPSDWSRLIPLQVICRNQLPVGASVFRRLAWGAVTLAQLGLREPPQPGQQLERPLIEFTTKLEEIDRFVTPEEAQALAGLDDKQFARVKELVLQVNAIVTRRAAEVGLVHADSKVELGIDATGQIMLVDTAGTPDENRFTWNGHHVTKQVLRDYYLARGLEKEVQVWAAQGRPRETWPRPERLPAEYVAAAADLYRSLCERWTGERIWGAPDLERVVERLASLRGQVASPPKPRPSNAARGVDLVIVGCQYGDEGKGRFTDVFARDAFAVVRYQAGPHTGHTVVTESGRFRFVQVPAGVLRGATGIIGNGCVINTGDLLEEIAGLERLRLPVKLRISEIAHVIFPYHLALDEAAERWRAGAEAPSDRGTGAGAIGSTRRGVGPCREDKVARIGLRMIDLLDEGLLAARLRRLVPLKRQIIEQGLGCRLEELSGHHPEDWNVDALVATYHGHGRRLASSLCNVSELLDGARREGRLLVYEGAQSVGLDVEHGSYPFCSSGYSAAGGVTVGTGSSPSIGFEVYGVVKAYASRVGGGPLPTEVAGSIADRLVERGREFGTVTGRRRRVGWLDLVAVRHAVRIDGVTRLCVSGLDVLAGLPEVQVAVGYAVDGTETMSYPAAQRDWARLRPVYTTLPGWPEQDWQEVTRRGLGALSDNARRYLDFISKQLGVGLAAVGVGPAREATIVLQMPGVPGVPDAAAAAEGA